MKMTLSNLLFITVFFLFGFCLVNCKRGNIHKRKTIGDYKERLWTDGVMPYSFAFKFNKTDRAMIDAAMKEWSDKTCIKFKEVKTGYHVQFRRKENACYALVGDNQKLYDIKTQPINLGANCFIGGYGSALHEIGHTLGLIHEHQRPDRDDYLEVNWKNVKESKASQLTKNKKGETFGLPYDFQSRMHYTPRAFALTGTYSFKVSKNRALDVAGDKGKGLSFTDVAAINIMYECGKKCATKCPKPGYLDKNCKCITPWSYAKDNCFNAIGDSACARKNKKYCVIMAKYGGYDKPSQYVYTKLVNQCRKFCGRCYRYVPSEWRKYPNAPSQPVPAPNNDRGKR